MMNIDEFAAVGTEIAGRAGKYALERLRTDFTVEHKGTINLVTEVDVAAEEMIVNRIREKFPDHSVLAEEKNAETRGGTCTWIIDPLDGTTNYAHGFPFFSVSIGLEISGQVVLGIVYDPVRDELFTARKDSGAFCNDEQIHVSRTESLNTGLLATGFPYDIRTSEENNLQYFCAFALTCQGIRRTGSAALDLCYLAAGRIDGFWESKLNPWDCAAGYLIVSEAGGRVTDYSGGPASIYKAEVVASNNRIHQEMLDVLKQTNASVTSD
jgi:myo-inositol-1(or 4)-monophosphatase